MPSYGAFCAEFCVKRPETNRDALRTQDRTKKAFFQNLKNAGRHRLTSEDFPNPPPSPLNKSNCSANTFSDSPRRTAPGPPQSIASSRTPQIEMVCQSRARTVPISKSYDQNNFALFSYLKMHQKKSEYV